MKTLMLYILLLSGLCGAAMCPQDKPPRTHYICMPDRVIVVQTTGAVWSGYTWIAKGAIKAEWTYQEFMVMFFARKWLAAEGGFGLQELNYMLKHYYMGKD